MYSIFAFISGTIEFRKKPGRLLEFKVYFINMKIVFSKRAEKMFHSSAKKLDFNLVVTMELYFSCFIRKRVLFANQAEAEAISIDTDIVNLHVFFLPVMTKACSVSESKDIPELESFPIKRPERFFPKKLQIDYKSGKWVGDFSFGS